MRSVALRWLVSGLALAFLVKAALTLAGEWGKSEVALELGWVLLSVLPALAASALQAEAFVALLRSLRPRASLGLTAYSLFFAAQLARYTPGKVGLPLVRVAGAERLGVSKSVMALATLFEVFAWIVMGVVVLAVPLAFHPAWPLALRPWVPPATLLCVVVGVTFFALLVFCPRESLPESLRARTAELGPGPLLSVRFPVLLLAQWLGWMAQGSLLALGLGASVEESLLLGAALIVATLAGFVSLLAPGGLGVRELVLAYLAAPLLGAKNAIAFGLLARAISLGVEVIAFGVTRLAVAGRGPSKGPETNQENGPRA